MSDIEEKLLKYNQKKVLEVYNSLCSSDKKTLENELSKVDFEKMTKLFSLTNNVTVSDISDISPLENVYVKYSLQENILNKWKSIGDSVIKDSHYAVVTMAGGQGTRLGYNLPKGTYMLDIFGKRVSIFELLITKLKEANRQYNVTIPWYIMTSEENNSDTIEFFEKNDFFGYDKSCVIFFKQGELPMQDTNGNIILSEKTKIKFASDGNGGVFKALCDNVLEDMKRRDIKYVYFSGVDNILVNFVDSIFLGGMIDKGYIAASKSVEKAYPEEKVGVICKRKGKPAVVEYSELPCEMRDLRYANNELVYVDANIVSNIFDIDLISKAGDLPYHVAKKKCKEYKVDGNVLEVDGYKYETFIFDIYNKLQDIFVFRVKREEEFAPIKNKEGEDSPETAVKLYTNFMTKNM